jgi:nucleotide-binding universal stress UspA family protein
MYKAVLVPLDGSEAAALALPAAVAWALRFSAALVLLRVVPTSHAGTGNGLSGADNSDGPRDYWSRVSQAEGYLEALKRSLLHRGVAIECLVRPGEAADVILATAAGMQDTMIVLAQFGRGPSAGRAMGAVAEAVVQAAACPVLVVPAEQTAEA